MINNNNCPFYGREFKCIGSIMDMIKMRVYKIELTTLTVLAEKIIVTDKDGSLEKKWTFLKKDDTRYIFEDLDTNQWILSEKLISYTRATHGHHFTFSVI